MIKKLDINNLEIDAQEKIAIINDFPDEEKAQLLEIIQNRINQRANLIYQEQLDNLLIEKFKYHIGLE